MIKGTMTTLEDLVNITTVLIFVATALLVWYVIKLPGMRNMPPGPFPLPVVGNSWMLARPGVTLLTLFAELTQKYGDLFTFKMGSKPIILINDLRLVQEAFVKRGDITSNRPQHYYVIRKIEKAVGLGVTLNNGQPWKELRRVSITAMREFGVGKQSLEEKIREEAVELLAVLDREKGGPVDTKAFLMMATSNVISSVIFGTRFDLKDPMFELLLQRLSEATSVNALFLPSNFLPFARFFDSKEDRFIEALQTTSAHIKDLLAGHEETFDPENIRDFVDLVLSMRKSEPKSRQFHDLNLRRAVVDLFNAGSETTATTLQWLLYYMATYPEVQARCQREIDEVLGNSRSVSYKDREQLRFTEATIQEVLRVRPVAPFGFPRYVDKDFELKGYTIPQGAVAFANIVAINNDPVYFVEPERFEPSRWMDEKGNITGRERLLSFSVGPRSCLGELVARMELFMFFTSILQVYTVRPEAAGKPVDLTPVLGFISKTRHQRIVLKRR